MNESCCHCCCLPFHFSPTTSGNYQDTPLCSFSCVHRGRDPLKHSSIYVLEEMMEREEAVLMQRTYVCIHGIAPPLLLCKRLQLCSRWSHAARRCVLQGIKRLLLCGDESKQRIRRGRRRWSGKAGQNTTLRIRAAVLWTGQQLHKIHELNCFPGHHAVRTGDVCTRTTRIYNMTGIWKRIKENKKIKS